MAKNKAKNASHKASKPAKAAKAVAKAAKPTVTKALKPSKPAKASAPTKTSTSEKASRPTKPLVAVPPNAPAKPVSSVKPSAKAEPVHPPEELVQAPVSAGKPSTVAEEASDDEIVLTDAEGRRYCRVKDCDQLSTVDGYCRYHYLLFWKRIQVRKKILSEGKLERYIEDLTARYPDKFLDMLRKDLRSEKEFLAAIQELEIDESAVETEFEDESQNFIEEVRGMGTESAGDEDF
jgi:hypothetical protein